MNIFKTVTPKVATLVDEFTSRFQQIYDENEKVSAAQQHIIMEAEAKRDEAEAEMTAAQNFISNFRSMMR